jgi:hypothetical protein
MDMVVTPWQLWVVGCDCFKVAILSGFYSFATEAASICYNLLTGAADVSPP